MANDKQRANTRGREAETFAAHYLADSGLKLLQKNFRCALGEIDLIMLDHETIVFVEVKYRTTHHFGYGMEYVSASKQRKLRNTALIFMKKNTQYGSLAQRFDVVDVSPSRSPATPNNLEVNWLKNALEMDW